MDTTTLFFVGGMSAIVLLLPTLLVAMSIYVRPAKDKSSR